MSGRLGGVHALISQRIEREVPYIHYFNHQLHLVVAHVCEMPVVHEKKPVVREYFDMCNLLSKFLSTSKV